MKKLLLPLLATLPCNAAMVMLTPNAVSYIRSKVGDAEVNFNNTELLTGRVGTSDWIRSALQFDLSSIPDNATITSVTLRLTINVNDGGSNGSGDNIGTAGFQLFQLTADADFTNGGNFSYKDRSFGADNSNGGTDDTPWTTAGGDFSAAALSTIATLPLTMVAAGDQFTFGSEAGFVSAISSNLADDNVQFLFRIPDLENTGADRKLLR